jgi:hypothetical protein
MRKHSRYVFSAALAGVALGGVPGLVRKANSAVVTAAAFTFENASPIFSSSGTSSTTNSTASPSSGSFFLFASSTGSTVGPLLADSGTGSAFGSHASTATVYSAPVGNGSQKSFSANHWLSGDLYEFDVPTTSLTGIMVSFDETSSSTGPHAFALEYVLGGTTGTAFTYSVGTTSFAASASSTAVSFGSDLSTITALNNESLVKFLLVDTDTTTATGGTDRVDNFIVSGTSTPEPSGLALLTVAGAAALYRRRKA